MPNQASSSQNPQKPLVFPLAFAALVMGSIAMGVSPVFVRTAEVGPFASAFWRVCLALPVLFIWVMAERLPERGMPKFEFSTPIILTGLLFAGDLFFWHLSIFNTTMANATFMACLAPVWVLMFAGIFIGEKVERNSYLGLLICLVGAATLIGSSYSIDKSRIVGDIYGFITSIFFGLYFLAVRVARRRHRSAEVTLSSSLITVVLLLITAIIAHLLYDEKFFPDTVQGAGSLFLLGAFSHAGGQGLLSVALGSLSAVFSSLVIFLEAIAGAFFGWLVFNENLSTGQLAGAGIILAGIWIARPRNNARDFG